MKTRKIVLALLIALLAVSTGSAGGAEKLRLAIGYIPHVQFAPLYVGIEKGFYRDAGIDLEIQYGFGIDIFSLLATERIDIGLSDSDQLILAGSKGLPLKAIFQYYRNYPVTIVAKKSDAATPADFAGKTIGTPELYGTSYIGLQLFLREYGLEKSVKVERIGYTQIISLQNDRVEGAVCFLNNEPLVLRNEGVAINTWDVRDFSEMVGASFISSDGIIRKKTETLKRFAEATGKAMAWTAAHPDEAVKISARVIGNTADNEEFLKQVLTATLPLFGSEKNYGVMDPALYRRSIALLREIGIIDREVTVDKVIRPLR